MEKIFGGIWRVKKKCLNMQTIAHRTRFRVRDAQADKVFIYIVKSPQNRSYENLSTTKKFASPVEL
jgi:hypothetical protein